MTNEKEAKPTHIVVTELDTLITKLTDAAFDCGDYDDSKSEDGYKILFAAEQNAIDDLKTYVATVRAEEREAAFKEAIEAANGIPSTDTFRGQPRSRTATEMRSAIITALKSKLTEK